jgi:pimeloyl-ACP methyl ester carboxylesterase
MHRTHTFILVHGAWQGSWSWEQTGAILANRGHQVSIPDLPGHDPADTRRSGVSHGDYVDAVLHAISQSGPDPVVLAGHCLGGAVISQVADRRPDRVARLVYCAAFVPRDGEAIGDLLGTGIEAALQRLSAESADRSISMPWDLWRSAFMQVAGMDTARAVYERLVPEPYRPIFEPVWLPRLATSGLPATYLSCRQDRTQAPVSWHTGMTSRLARGPLVEIDGDHQALITAPRLLADALCAAAEPTVQPEVLPAA